MKLVVELASHFAAKLNVVPRNETSRNRVQLPYTRDYYFFRFPRWSVVDVDFVLGLLHCMVVGDDADVSEAYAAPIFRVQVCSEDARQHIPPKRQYRRPQLHGVTTQEQN